MLTHALFLLFVAVAVYVQGLTGFALSLILLGLVGVTDLLPLPDVANAVAAIAVINAGVFLHRRQALRLDRHLLPAVAAGAVGALAGMALLTVLAHGAREALRLILGLSIVGCALLLWRTAGPLDRASPPRAFALVGGLAGVLGGLFSAPGPPLVYLMYRQPWPLARIQESLILFFGLSGLLRLTVLASTGQVSGQAVVLAAEALPVVLLATLVSVRGIPRLSPTLLRRGVCLLLIAAGVTMAGSAASGMIWDAPTV